MLGVMRRGRLDVNPFAAVGLGLVLPLFLLVPMHPDRNLSRWVLLPEGRGVELTCWENMRAVTIERVADRARVWLDDRPMASAGELRVRIAENAVLRADGFVLYADARLPFGEVAPVIAAIRDHGPGQLLLRTRAPRLRR
jgi:hypothetical protein